MRRIYPTTGFSTVASMALVLLAFLVGASGAYGVYIWQHDQVNSLNSQVTSLNRQISHLVGQTSATCPNAQQLQGVCAAYTYASAKGVTIRLFSPARNETVASPVAVIGEVPGGWSFEAQFPVRLVDSKGTIVASATAHVLGNWQTSELVPFSAQLTFASSAPGTGQIVLEKDNPSGLSANSDTLTLPVKF